MLIDLHNHTKRCNHATGEMSEYVKAAIAAGTHTFGFSDHVPMDFDKKWRMDFSQMQEYEVEVRELKQKYLGKIEVLLGYEVDFVPGHIDERVLKANVDYLIGSVHFLDGWGFDNPEFIGEYKNRDIDMIWQEYFDAIKAMANSGLFDIVGHLDLLKVFKFLPKKDIRLLAKEALKAIKKADLVVEINAAGFRKPIGEPYPSKALLEEIYELGINISFGSDAHSVEQVSADNGECEKLAKQIGFSRCATFLNRDKKLVAF